MKITSLPVAPAVRLALALLVGGHLLAPVAQAAGYLEFEGIPGESTNRDFENWIEIESIQFNAGRPISRPGGSPVPGKPIVSDLSLIKRMDRASPLLFLAAVTGTPKRAEIHFTKPSPQGEKVYLEITLHDVLVSSISTSGSEEFLETVSLNFSRIDMRYIPDKGEPVVVSYTISSDI